MRLWIALLLMAGLVVWLAFMTGEQHQRGYDEGYAAGREQGAFYAYLCASDGLIRLVEPPAVFAFDWQVFTACVDDEAAG